MPVPLSTDLRWIVWLHHNKELGIEDIADLLYIRIHFYSKKNSLSLFNTSGNVAPASYKPRPKRLLSELEEYTIIELLLANPGIYLDELQ